MRFINANVGYRENKHWNLTKVVSGALLLGAAFFSTEKLQKAIPWSHDAG